jgi:hypothetical protein
LRAISIFLDEHPWDNSQNSVEIDELFTSSAYDVIMIQPLYWQAQGYGCSDEYRVPIEVGNTLSEYPTDDVAQRACNGQEGAFLEACLDRHQNVFEGLYQNWGHVDIDAIVTSSENDWDIFGNGCRSIDECDIWPGHWAIEACQFGYGDFDDKMYNGAIDESGNVDCYIVACNQLRWERRDWMIRRLTERQRAAERARARHPDALLRVWHNVEVVFTGTEDWQFITVVEDVLPHVPQVDSVSISMYEMSDGPGAIDWISANTGLPFERIFIGEIGHRIHSKQYARIFDWVDEAFSKGVRLAFIWDIEYNSDAHQSQWTVVDRDTWEWFPGMEAIRDLNEKWRGTE